MQEILGAAGGFPLETLKKSGGNAIIGLRPAEGPASSAVGRRSCDERSPPPGGAWNRDGKTV